ncbi:type II toxin-antitoxin system antitoxin SocA domain-containing protein [Umezawaea sp.]|uniref:type II toxin-antitoxin system antitoxin SocA domain-containing protein n=1 Tax=Umezawaea sp. TaxID=1955258 RepID=UPI002ED47E42
MADVHDVAAALLAATGPESPMKLQKLLYYSQAWHLAGRGTALFDAPIEAWSRGPVVPEVYRRHVGLTEVHSWDEGDPSRLAAGERAVVESVVERYAGFSRHELSEMAHEEEPWRSARGALPDSEPSSAPIPHEAMRRYFRRLTSDPETAVAEARASVGLEGLSVSTEALEAARAVVRGEVGADEAVARRIEALLRS